MKKFLTLALIVLAICVCLTGCVDNDAEQPAKVTYTAEAGTTQSIGEIKASDYRKSDYYANDYFIAVMLTAKNAEPVQVLNEKTNTYNFMLLMSDGDELLKVIRPIKEMFAVNVNPETKTTEYAIVFYSNYSLEERDFTLSISLGEDKYETIKLTEQRKNGDD